MARLTALWARLTAPRSSDPVIRAEPLDDRIRPALPYYLIMGCVLFLTGIGFVLVYSAISVRALENPQSFPAEIAKSVIFTVFGVLGMFISSRFRLAWWRVLSLVIFAFAFVLQIVTLFVGTEIGGNKNWLDLGFVTVQAAELLKVGFIMVLALMFAYVRFNIRAGIGAVAYLTGLCGLTVGPVLLAGDLGSASVFVIIFMLMCIICGVSKRYLSFFTLAGVFAAGVLVAIRPSRLARVTAFLSFSNSSGPPSQGDHARWAIGNGGLLGQGPGASREKWRHLPTADSDYIFAILGEEYGFIGATFVLCVFIVLVYQIFTVALLHTDRWARIACVGVGSWIATQTFVNVGVVIGVLPVLGVPLPFISRGYSALLSILMAIGFVLTCARSLPGAKEALQSRSIFRHHKASSVVGRGRRKVKP